MLLIRAWDLNVYLISLNNIQNVTISKRVHICYLVVKMYLKLTSSILWYFDVDKNCISLLFFNNNGGNTNSFYRVVMRGTYHRSCTWQVVKHQICIE